NYKTKIPTTDIFYQFPITDTHGNLWTITADHRVAVNGVADPKTANVTHLIFLNGKVLLEDTSNMWWEKKSASSEWIQLPGEREYLRSCFAL
ncbi:MAG: hypothetical protein ACJ8AW_34960, partial [Rhodopila sp.]